jgi:hypothetical protein
MRRYSLRFLVASLTFTLGIAIVWAFHLIPRLETRLIDSFSSSDNSDLSPVGPLILDSAADVNEIYRVLVHEKFTFNGEAKLIVLQSQTTGCPVYEDESPKREWGPAEPFHQVVKEMMPEVESQLLDDYLEKNKTPESLKVLDLDLNYVLVNDSDLPNDEFDRFWTKFYKKFPDSSGIIFFSKVGFNAKHDQAFVYAGRSCGGLCGAGEYILLQKLNGMWVIKQERGLWVS